jgi:hypothetical protein
VMLAPVRCLPNWQMKSAEDKRPFPRNDR